LLPEGLPVTGPSFSTENFRSRDMALFQVWRSGWLFNKEALRTQNLLCWQRKLPMTVKASERGSYQGAGHRRKKSVGVLNGWYAMNYGRTPTRLAESVQLPEWNFWRCSHRTNTSKPSTLTSSR
jgi:hypothetical protein